MQNLNEGLLFDPALSAEIKDRFYYVDADPEFGQRLFFENSGGSLRLKASVEAQAKYQAFPDCPERLHDRSRALKKVQLHGIDGQHRAQCQHAARSGDPIAHLTPPGEQPRRTEHGVHQHEPPDDHAAAGEQHCTRKF